MLTGKPEVLDLVVQDEAEDVHLFTVNGKPHEGPVDGSLKANKAEVKAQFSQSDLGGVPTLKRIMKWLQIDESVWFVSHWKPKLWQMGYKDSDGVAHRLPLLSVILNIERIERIEIDIPPPPVIRLANPPQAPRVIHGPYDGIGKAIFASDFHIGYRRDMRSGQIHPYHDRPAIMAMLELASRRNIDTLILGGDLLDVPEFTSRFPRKPEDYFTLRPAVIEAKWLLTQMRIMLPDTRIVWMEGNHEVRLRTFTRDQMIAAYDLTDYRDDDPLLSAPNLVGLSEIDVEWLPGYPDNEIWLNRGLRAIHGGVARAKAGQTASFYAKELRINTVFGHIHRREQISDAVYDRPGMRRVTEGMSPGMMGIPEMVPAAKERHDWQVGFAGIDYVVNGLGYNYSPVSVEGGSLLDSGELIIGADYTEKLRHDTGWSIYGTAQPTVAV